MPAFDVAFARSVATPDEARDWTSGGECPYPTFTFYHFTTKPLAHRIRCLGFTHAIGSGGFVWLTRDRDDAVAATNGPIRLSVAIRAHRLLVVLPNETMEGALVLSGCGGEDRAACLAQKGYCGVWDNDQERPWVGIVSPESCRIVA